LASCFVFGSGEAFSAFPTWNGLHGRFVAARVALAGGLSTDGKDLDRNSSLKKSGAMSFCLFIHFSSQFKNSCFREKSAFYLLKINVMAA
jgi:hypothetical protein